MPYEESYGNILPSPAVQLLYWIFRPKPRADEPIPECEDPQVPIKHTRSRTTFSALKIIGKSFKKNNVFVGEKPMS